MVPMIPSSAIFSYRDRVAGSKKQVSAEVSIRPTLLVLVWIARLGSVCTLQPQPAQKERNLLVDTDYIRLIMPPSYRSLRAYKSPDKNQGSLFLAFVVRPSHI